MTAVTPAESDILLRLQPVVFAYYSARPTDAQSQWKLRIPTAIELHSGYAYSLLGDNTSGKSTFIRLMAGLIDRPWATVSMEFAHNRLLLPRDRLQLISLGFRVAHQNDPLFPHLSIWDNICLGAPTTCIHRANRHNVASDALKYLKRLHVDRQVRLSDSLSTLSGGGVALVRLLRTIAWGFRLVVLDESTTNLDPDNRILFFEVLRDALANTSTIVFVSHQSSDHQSLVKVAKQINLVYSTIKLEQGLLCNGT